MSQQKPCGVSNPGGTPCTKDKGHPYGHDEGSYGPLPAAQPVSSEQGTPWCESCQSYHPVPRDESHRVALGCAAGSEEVELKACPFCGGVAGDVSLKRGHGFIIGCNTCQAQQFAMSRQEAVKLWNTRTSPVIDGAEDQELQGDAAQNPSIPTGQVSKDNSQKADLTLEEAAARDNYCPRCRMVSFNPSPVVAYCACGDGAWADCCADQECSSCGLPFQVPAPTTQANDDRQITTAPDQGSLQHEPESVAAHEFVPEPYMLPICDVDGCGSPPSAPIHQVAPASVSLDTAADFEAALHLWNQSHVHINPTDDYDLKVAEFFYNRGRQAGVDRVAVEGAAKEIARLTNLVCSNSHEPIAAIITKHLNIQIK